MLLSSDDGVMCAMAEPRPPDGRACQRQLLVIESRLKNVGAVVWFVIGFNNLSRRPQTRSDLVQLAPTKTGAIQDRFTARKNPAN